MKIKKGWKEKTVWNPKGKLGQWAKGTFAKISLGENNYREGYTIYYFPRTWYMLIWPIIKFFAKKHEICHMYGIPFSGCLGNHKWCIMAEEHMVGSSEKKWIGKIKLLFFQMFHPKVLFRWGRLCPSCKKVIKNNY